MNLSKNLSLREVIKSNTATKYGIDNNPSPKHLENLKQLAEKVFQPCREYFGKAIFISSGYRSDALNDRIGGSKTSQHSTGQALDLDCDVYGGMTNGELFDYLRANVVYDQLIWEFGDTANPDWVHISYKSGGGNRKQVLKAMKIGGSTTYAYYA